MLGVRLGLGQLGLYPCMLTDVLQPVMLTAGSRSACRMSRFIPCWVHTHLHSWPKAQISNVTSTGPAHLRARIKTRERLAPSLFLNLLNHTVPLLLTLTRYLDCLAAASPCWCLTLAPRPTQPGCQLKGIQSTNVLFLDSPVLLRPLLWRMTSLTSFTLFVVPEPDSVVAAAWVNRPVEQRSRRDVFLSTWTRAVAGICGTFQMNIQKSIF